MKETRGEGGGNQGGHSVSDAVTERTRALVDLCVLRLRL